MVTFFNNGTDSSRGVAILVSPHFNYTLINTSQDSSGRVLAVTIILTLLLPLVTFYLRHVPSIKNFTPPKQLILTRNDLSSIFLFPSYPPPTSNHVNFLSPPLNLNRL